jgi:hypothetical protein
VKRTVLVLLAVSALTACNANLGLRFGTSGVSATQPSVGSGSSLSSGGVNVSVMDASFLQTLFGVGLAGFLFGRDEPASPRLAPDRPVQEQDCTQPVPTGSANLRCR